MKQIVIPLIVGGFDGRFSWSKGEADIGFQDACPKCQSTQFKQGEWGVDTICVRCNESFFFDKIAKEKHWKIVSSIRRALSKALSDDADITEEQARQIAVEARDDTLKQIEKG